MKLKRGTLWIYFGLLLLAAALFLTAYNRNESYQAQQLSIAILEEMREALAQTASTQPDALQASAPESAETEPMEAAASTDSERPMPVRTINGRNYIGVLTIPALELELPVLSQWGSTNLRIAPCWYAGSVYSENLIICAHNYSSHFGRINSLREGDTVMFTDMDDNVYTYEMVALETLGPADVEEMESGDWDLTLFTCTVGGQSRVTARFARKKAEY